MERIDFYILPTAEPRAVELFTCRLAEKAYTQDHRIFIRTRDQAQTELLDELLWTFRQGSFLPHGPAAAGEDEPILLGETVPPTAQHDLLINLGSALPPQWESFQRLAEVVDQHPELLEAARMRFRSYRERGYHPHYHKLEAGA